MACGECEREPESIFQNFFSCFSCRKVILYVCLCNYLVCEIDVHPVDSMVVGMVSSEMPSLSLGHGVRVMLQHYT